MYFSLIFLPFLSLCASFIDAYPGHNHRVPKLCADAVDAVKRSMAKIRCLPREQLVDIVHSHEELIRPHMALVNRCSGDCGEKFCSPISRRNVTIMVEVDYIFCEERRVEEHIECECIKEKKCSRRKYLQCQRGSGIWKENTCTCIKRSDYGRR